MFRRLIAAIAATTLSAGLLASVGTATAAADETMCQPGYTKVTLSSVKSPWQLTHVERHTIGAHVQREITHRAAFNLRLGARLKVTTKTSTSVGANLKRLIRARVGTTFSGTAVGWGEYTKKKVVKVTDTIKASNKTKRYVAFKAHRHATGWWQSYHCTSDGKRMLRGKGGKYWSWKRSPASGIIPCSDRFAAASAEAKAINVGC
jgi:hypothetical protein